MKILLIALLMTAGSYVYADQTVKEGAAATANDVKRAAKKGAHRVEEAFCAEGDVECAAKKAKNRVKEGAEAVKDKTKETADKIDTNKKSNN